MKVDKNRIYLEASEASGRRHAKYNLYTSLTHHYLMVDQTSRRLMVTSDDERDIPAIAGWQVFLYRNIRDAVTLPPRKGGLVSSANIAQGLGICFQESNKLRATEFPSWQN